MSYDRYQRHAKKREKARRETESVHEEMTPRRAGCPPKLKPPPPHPSNLPTPLTSPPPLKRQSPTAISLQSLFCLKKLWPHSKLFRNDPRYQLLVRPQSVFIIISPRNLEKTHAYFLTSPHCSLAVLSVELAPVRRPVFSQIRPRLVCFIA